MMDEKKDGRYFSRKEKVKGALWGAEILVDTQTGVNYIKTAYSLTPLLGKDGKPVVDPTR